MKRVVSAIACFLASFISFAQTKSSEPRVEFTSISVLFGGVTTLDNYSNGIDDFKKLAPNSDFLKEDLSKFDNSSFYFGTNTGPAFNVNSYFNIKNKEGKTVKYNPHFRIGITYTNQTLVSRSSAYSEIFRVDTLVSTIDGSVYYVDSIYSENYFMDYNREQLFIDGAYMVSSNPKSRFKFYAGLGVSLGLTFNSNTIISSFSGNYLESGVQLQNSNFYAFPESGNYEEEIYQNKESFSFMASIPLGLELRLSKKPNTWGNCRLYFEGRPSLSFVDIPELGSNLSTSNIWGTGFRYDF